MNKCYLCFLSIVWCSESARIYDHNMDRAKRIWYLSPMRAAKVQASLRIRAVSPEPPLLAHTSSESRGTVKQKAQIPGPSEWLDMRSWNLSWRNARRHKFAWRGSYYLWTRVCTFQTDLQLYVYMYLERRYMYMYFEKVSIVFLYIMQHLDTSGTNF